MYYNFSHYPSHPYPKHLYKRQKKTLHYNLSRDLNEINTPTNRIKKKKTKSIKHKKIQHIPYCIRHDRFRYNTNIQNLTIHPKVNAAYLLDTIYHTLAGDRLWPLHTKTSDQ